MLLHTQPLVSIATRQKVQSSNSPLRRVTYAHAYGDIGKEARRTAPPRFAPRGKEPISSLCFVAKTKNQNLNNPRKTGAMSQVENVEQFVSQLKVVELREELKKRHLSYAGNKKDLAQRLQEAMSKEKEDQQEEDQQEEDSVEETTPAESQVTS